MTYLTVPLHASHKKENFTCGNELLDTYFHVQARQDVKRKLATCFVLLSEDQIVMGFYTLSNAGINRELVPDEIKNKLPKTYTSLPTTLLGRLAVNNQHKGQGIGELLLLDALKRSYDTAVISIASMAVIVDPIDEVAVRFYKKYGFVALPDSGKMFLPMKTIASLF
jgi:predicted GNAT family N-acyltransferase